MVSLPEALGLALLALLPSGASIIQALSLTGIENNVSSVKKVFTALYLHYLADYLCIDLAADWILAYVILP